MVWQGDVEVFDLIEHPQARQGYAWGFQDDTGDWEYVASLKIPPAETPQDAVRAYIVAQQRR